MKPSTQWWNGFIPAHLALSTRDETPSCAILHVHFIIFTNSPTLKTFQNTEINMTINTHGSVKRLPFSAKTATERSFGKMSILTQGNLESLTTRFQLHMLSTSHHLSNSVIFQNSGKLKKYLNITSCHFYQCAKKNPIEVFQCSFPIAFPSRIPLRNKIPSWGQVTHGRSHASTKTPPTNPSALPGTSDIFTASFFA